MDSQFRKAQRRLWREIHDARIVERLELAIFVGWFTILGVTGMVMQ